MMEIRTQGHAVWPMSERDLLRLVIVIVAGIRRYAGMTLRAEAALAAGDPRRSSGVVRRAPGVGERDRDRTVCALCAVRETRDGRR
jgi:hypothetical protein